MAKGDSEDLAESVRQLGRFSGDPILEKWLE